MEALIDDMASLVDRYRSRDDPAGYFAALYLGVTREVQRGIGSGRFSRPEHIERLTNTFAHRYLDAAASKDRPASWMVAYDAVADRSVTIVQHLLLGMNAHINLDLGIACAHTAPGDSITSIRRDFDEINDVLAESVDRVQASLSEVSWLYRFVGDVADSDQDAVINFSIGRARAQAWKFAVELAAMAPVEAAAKVERHDAVVAALGTTIAGPPWWSRAGLRVVRFTERSKVSEVIDVFDRIST